MILCTVIPVRPNGFIKGWRIIAPSGAVMNATTKREADAFANFINEELTFTAKEAYDKGMAVGLRSCDAISRI